MPRTDEYAEAHYPHAAALICAVADYDAAQVQEVLQAPGVDLAALCVVLASLVPPGTQLPSFRLELHPSVEQLVLATATHCKVRPADIMGAGRTTEAVEARQLVCYLAFEEGQSYSAIGRAVKRDHTTVMHAVEKVRRTPRLRMAALVIAGSITITAAA